MEGTDVCMYIADDVGLVPQPPHARDPETVLFGAVNSTKTSTSARNSCRCLSCKSLASQCDRSPCSSIFVNRVTLVFK